MCSRSAGYLPRNDRERTVFKPQYMSFGVIFRGLHTAEAAAAFSLRCRLASSSSFGEWSSTSWSSVHMPRRSYSFGSCAMYAAHGDLAPARFSLINASAMRSSCAGRPGATPGGSSQSLFGHHLGNGLGGDGGSANTMDAGHRAMTCPVDVGVGEVTSVRSMDVIWSRDAAESRCCLAAIWEKGRFLKEKGRLKPTWLDGLGDEAPALRLGSVRQGRAEVVDGHVRRVDPALFAPLGVGMVRRPRDDPRA